jgi:hypothetical protein
MARTVSSPFRVQVRAPAITPRSQAFGSIDDLAFEGPAPLNVWVDPQGSGSGRPATGKHANHQFCPADGKFYTHGGDGGYPGATVDSGAVHSFRYTVNAQRNSLTFDTYYPYWGVSGAMFPGGAGCNTWAWDGSRGCFWTFGGFYEGVGWMRTNRFLVGNVPDSQSVAWQMLWRFWVAGPNAGTWEKVLDLLPFAHGEGQNGIYHPPSDCLIWMNDGDHRLAWYNCATGATGRVSSGRTPIAQVSEEPSVWDSVTNEFIYQDIRNGGGIFAVSLANFPSTCTTRTLWTGYEAGGISGGLAQHPIFIRNRKLYTFGIPRNASLNEQSNLSGNGLGIYELDLTTLEMRQGSQPYFELFSTAVEAPHKIAAMNEGAYSPIDDVLMVTNKLQPGVGSAPLILKWTPPSWTPAAGNVKAITTDSAGSATNTLRSVFPNPRLPWPHNGAGAVLSAWSSAAYARNLSTNGVLLIRNGGDGDYWGNETYGFDLDTRRWRRLTEPSLAPTGNPSADRALSPSDPHYFDRVENCEHGPKVAEYGWGLLPVGTQPGVPHSYDGLEYIPGNWIGNLRGALVTPCMTFVYTTASTTRAHYLDLDQVVYGRAQQWGRLSTNRITPFTPQLPLTALDEQLGRIYHNYGYLDLSNKSQVARSWGGVGLGYDTSSEFDPRRRLWVEILGSDTQGMPGQLAAVAVDSSSNFQLLNLAGTLWDRWNGRYGGIVYCPPLDCFFFYNQARGDQLNEPQVIYKIQPPDTNNAAAALTATWTVTRIVMPGDRIVNDPAVRGTYGRLRWIPPLKCIAFFHLANGPVYLYKPLGV